MNFLKDTNKISLWLVILMSFCINLPTAFMSVSLGLFLIFFILSVNKKTPLNVVLTNPGAAIALVLFLLYCLGSIYSSAPINESLHYLKKYGKLLLIPILIVLLRSEKYRQYSINAFLVSSILYLLVSYLNFFGIFNFGVMRHGIIFSLAMYMMMTRAKQTIGWHRATWACLAALTFLNILFICDVRTGQITSLALFILFSFENWGIKSLKYWLGLIILAVIFMQVTHSVPSSRLTNIKEEIAAHHSDGQQTSAGQRLEMYSNTITLIKKHPLFGGGTGSLRNEYLSLIENSKTLLTRVTNPHNQYLMTTQELGVLGLFVLLAFWSVHWWQSFQLPNKEFGLGFRALILMMTIGSLFNSLLLDSGEGKAYCILAGVLLSSYQSKNNVIGNYHHKKMKPNQYSRA
jgi:O-antigen ligase